MESLRQNKRQGQGIQKVYTRGGWGEYEINEEEINNLFRILLLPKKTLDMRKIILSLFTNRELADVTRRLMIAKLLTNGKTADYIAKKAQTGHSTISLVRKMLKWNPDLVKMLNPKIKTMPDIEKQIINRLKKGK